MFTELNTPEKRDAIKQHLICKEVFSGDRGLMWPMTQQLEAESVSAKLKEYPTLTRLMAWEEFLAFSRRERLHF
jgi:hypothetical protein